MLEVKAGTLDHGLPAPTSNPNNTIKVNNTSVKVISNDNYKDSHKYNDDKNNNTTDKKIQMY